MTGLRAVDDYNRRARIREHGSAYLTEGMMVYHPLSHWTDLMVRRYLRQHNIPADPSSAPGEWNGCRCCAGSWKFMGNPVERMRRRDYDHWWEFIVKQGSWLPLLVVKYMKPSSVVAAAVDRLGGPEAVARDFPHVFDYGQIPPRPDYRKE